MRFNYNIFFVSLVLSPLQAELDDPEPDVLRNSVGRHVATNYISPVAHDCEESNPKAEPCKWVCGVREVNPDDDKPGVHVGSRSGCSGLPGVGLKGVEGYNTPECFIGCPLDDVKH